MPDDEDADLEEEIAKWHVDFERLVDSARGRGFGEVELLIRDWAATYAPLLPSVDIALMARVLTDRHWARKHPVAATALAWKHRDSRSPRRSLRWLWKPRFSG
jgi:hypothetical protein